MDLLKSTLLDDHPFAHMARGSMRAEIQQAIRKCRHDGVFTAKKLQTFVGEHVKAYYIRQVLRILEKADVLVRIGYGSYVTMDYYQQKMRTVQDPHDPHDAR